MQFNENVNVNVIWNGEPSFILVFRYSNIRPPSTVSEVMSCSCWLEMTTCDFFTRNTTGDIQWRNRKMRPPLYFSVLGNFTSVVHRFQ